MFPLDPTVRRESIRMLWSVSAITILMLIIFAFMGYFDMTVVWGALLGAGWAVLNFFLLGISIQKIGDRSPAAARNGMQLSYMLRLLLTGVVVFIGIKLPIFNWIAVVVPLIFPRIAILLFNLMQAYHTRKEADK